MDILDRATAARVTPLGAMDATTIGTSALAAPSPSCGADRPVLLLVNAPEPHGSALRALATRRGLGVLTAPGEVAEVSGRERVGLCVVGVDDGSGAERVQALRKTFRGAAVVAVGRALGVDVVVRLMRFGAADVVSLAASPEDVAARCLACAPHRASREEPQELVGASAPMRSLRVGVARVAATRATVLLTGETGTGKGLVARTLHRLSDRADAPLVHVDCTALSPTVIESELFGHERGAFTGAASRHAGRFERAANGTVFLDEIGDLDATLQSKLLHVLQDRQFERVGGDRPLAMTARVIAATSRDLRREVALGRFRPDLYFRLAVFQLEVPPLRERLEDIPALVEVLLEQIGERLGIVPPPASAAFVERLREHAWPGNVRELVNVLERVVIEADGETLAPWHLADALRSASGLLPPPEAGGPALERPVDGGIASAASERDAIRAVLVATGGNVSRAARRLQMPRGTLRLRIRDYQLDHLVPKD